MEADEAAEASIRPRARRTAREAHGWKRADKCELVLRVRRAVHRNRELNAHRVQEHAQ